MTAVASLDRTTARLVHEAVLSTAPSIRNRIAGTPIECADVMSSVQDRVVRSLGKFDPARGTLPAFAQHISRWAVATALSRPRREVPVAMLPSEAGPTSWRGADPAEIVVARDERRRLLAYVFEFAREADLALLVGEALGGDNPTALTARGVRRARERVAAIAGTVRRAMRADQVRSMRDVGACVVGFQGATAAVGLLCSTGVTDLTDLRGRGSAAFQHRAELIAQLAANTGVTERVARDRVQNGCRLLRIAATVLEREGQL